MAIEEWYRQLPIVTRTYVTLAFITTAGCALEIITPFNVYYNSKLIFQKYELWRLLTNFFYFGSFASFRGRSADFMWMLMLGGGMLLSVAPFVNVQFFGASLTFMMVYVWGRRHQYINLSFLGIFNFTAPYLPWVLLSFSLLLGSSPVIDLLGMGAVPTSGGHSREALQYLPLEATTERHYSTYLWRPLCRGTTVPISGGHYREALQYLPLEATP
eukprot:gene16495-22722_t